MSNKITLIVTHSLAFLLIGCPAAFLTGCATAKLPNSPVLSSVAANPNAKRVGLVKVTDERGQVRVGSIGATSITVDRNIADYLNNHLSAHLMTQMNLNPNIVSSVQSSISFKNKRTIEAKIKSISISSFDAIMDPVNVDLVVDFKIYNGSGKKLFQRDIAAHYKERIGITIVHNSTGRLMEQVVKKFLNIVSSDISVREALRY